MPPAQPHLDRDGFDSIVQQRINALMEAAEMEQAEARRRAARQTARALEQRATAFAEGVESGYTEDGPISFEQAVVIPGKLRTVVCTERDYAATPFYWQALASQPEQVIHGADLLAELRGGDGQPPG